MTRIPQILDNHMRKPTALIHFERSLSVVEQKVMTLIIFHCQMAEKDSQGFYYSPFANQKMTIVNFVVLHEVLLAQVFEG